MIALPVFGTRNFIEQFLKIDPLIPDVERRHPRELAQVLAVGANGVFTMAPFGARGAARDFDTHDQALEVPFPRSRQRLVEIVDIEDQYAFGRGEAAKVREMAITARLNRDPRDTRIREIPRLNDRRTAEKSERRHGHPLILNREQTPDSADV